MNKKKSHGLTVLMLKDGIAQALDAIKEPGSVQSAEVTAGSVTGKLYFKQSAIHAPSWVKLFESSLGTTLNKLFNSGTAAVFILSVEKRFFALTFGYGKSLLRPDCYEENFGLRAVLNSVDPDKLRSVDAQSLDAVPLNRRSQASVATAIADFGLDIEQDLVYAATGQPMDASFGKQLSGKDALKISIPMTTDDIPPLLTKLALQYEAETYKARFSWIDNLREVRSKALGAELDDALTLKIQSGDFERTWLAIPEIIEWSDIAGFRYQKPKQGQLHGDIGWESYLAFLGGDIPHTAETFRKQNVVAISESSGQQSHAWPVYRCICCELSHDGADYALNNGKWFKVDADYLESLNDAIKQIPACDLPLPVYKGNDEGAYNESVYSSNTAYFALMDKQMIQHGGGNSKIEFCDLFTTDNHLIHVKRYGGSSVLSHLFAQGTVSARLLLSDSEFRLKVNAKLPLSHQLKDASQKPSAGEFEVVYAIASNNATASPELPLFSKINLRNSFNQLRMYGMKVSLAFIQVQQQPAE